MNATTKPIPPKSLALDVYDLLHLFGCEPISFHAFRWRFRAQFGQARRSWATDNRTWDRLKARLVRFGVPHEIVLLHVGASVSEQAQKHVRFLPGAREFVTRVLERAGA